MMVQHILSAGIFNTIFNEQHFYQENNTASELNKVTGTFFTGNIRRQTLGGIKHYYDADAMYNGGYHSYNGAGVVRVVQ